MTGSHRFFHLLLIAALIWQGLAPFAYALQPAGDGGNRILICTADGIRWINPANPDESSEEAPALPRCPLCVLQSLQTPVTLTTYASAPAVFLQACYHVESRPSPIPLSLAFYQRFSPRGPPA